jgi:hypothetical protein
LAVVETLGRKSSDDAPKVLLAERSKAALMLSLELRKMWIDEQIKDCALTLHSGTHL